MQTALDLTRVWKSFRHGDLTVILSWYRDPRTTAGARPCLVLIPAYASLEHLIPCVVTLDKAWIWSEEIGDEELAGRAAGEFAASLGMSGTAHDFIRIRSLIVDHLGDLLAMPPLPTELVPKTVIGEGRITERESGTIVSEGEITVFH